MKLSTLRLIGEMKILQTLDVIKRLCDPTILITAIAWFGLLFVAFKWG